MNINIIEFKKLLKSLAVLDTILMPDWEQRYFSYDAKWDTNEEMASIKTGNGEEFFILFKSNSVIGKYYDGISNNNINLKTIPSLYNDFLIEPAFNMKYITNIFYKETDKSNWVFLSNEEIKYPFFNPENYKKWAEEYYEITIELELVNYIFNFNPLNNSIVRKINNEISINDILEDISEIDYPIK